MSSKQYRRIEDYPVPAIKERFNHMYTSYDGEDYGEAVNYAGSMIESTCKYCYFQIKKEEIEGNSSFLKSNVLLKKTIDLFKNEISTNQVPMIIEDDLFIMFKNTVSKIGKIRNETSVSHGSRVRVKGISKDETKFIMMISENICTFLMDLLHTKTHSQKKGAIGSILDTRGLTQYANDYVDGDTRYTTTGGIIYSLNKTLSVPGIDIKIEEEFIWDHIKDFIEDDSICVGETGKNEYKYFSENKDLNYIINISHVENKVEIYISREM